MKYAWITAQAGYAVRTMCKTLDVSSSGYYAWRSRKPSGRMLDDARLLQRIRQLHSVSREAYGTERMWQSLRQHGESCGRHRVQRLRRMHAIQSKRRRRYLHTRSAYQRVPAAPNLLAWPFASAQRSIKSETMVGLSQARKTVERTDSNKSAASLSSANSMDFNIGLGEWAKVR